MCGLFGIVPIEGLSVELVGKARHLFATLARLNDERGGDAWGVWGRGQDVVKGLGEIGTSGRYKLNQLVKAWSPSGGEWLVGHTRFGTHGSNSISNAHPFKVGGKVLAHNGVVAVDGFQRHHVVDSGQIIHAVDALGWVAGMKRVSGSCALLVSDGAKLLAYRDNQELSIAKTEVGWVISSSYLHLVAALRIAGITEPRIDQLETGVVVAPWDASWVPIEAPTSPRTSSLDWADYRHNRASVTTMWGDCPDDGADELYSPHIGMALAEQMCDCCGNVDDCAFYYDADIDAGALACGACAEDLGLEGAISIDANGECAFCGAHGLVGEYTGFYLCSDCETDSIDESMREMK